MITSTHTHTHTHERTAASLLPAQFNESEREKLAIAAARKERMLQLEAEKRRMQQKSGGEKSPEDAAQDQGVLDRAATLMTEEMDAVKRMNQMVLYSKCVTIRDAQLEAKREIKEQEEEDTRSGDKKNTHKHTQIDSITNGRQSTGPLNRRCLLASLPTRASGNKTR